MQYVIPAVAAIIVAIIEAIAAKERNDRKKDKEAELKRANERKEESRLSMKMMDAALQLSVVTANALTGGHNNGNVERAKESAQKASEAYQEFLHRVASDSVNS